MANTKITRQATKSEDWVLDQSLVLYASGSTFSLLKGQSAAVSKIGTTFYVSSSYPCAELQVRNLHTTIHNATGSADGHAFKVVSVIPVTTGSRAPSTIFALNLTSGSGGTGALSAPSTAITASVVISFKVQ